MATKLQVAKKYYKRGKKAAELEIKSFLKDSDLIVHGSKATNAHLPDWLDKATEDWDIFSETPKKTAERLEKALDERYGGNYFRVEPAIHKGSFRIKSVVTSRVVADVTLPQRTIDYQKIDKINYATLEYHVEQIRKTLADPTAAYRHNKDLETLQRIEIYDPSLLFEEEVKDNNKKPIRIPKKPSKSGKSIIPGLKGIR